MERWVSGHVGLEFAYVEIANSGCTLCYAKSLLMAQKKTKWKICQVNIELCASTNINYINLISGRVAMEESVNVCNEMKWKNTSILGLWRKGAMLLK